LMCAHVRPGARRRVRACVCNRACAQLSCQSSWHASVVCPTHLQPQLLRVQQCLQVHAAAAVQTPLLRQPLTSVRAEAEGRPRRRTCRKHVHAHAANRPHPLPLAPATTPCAPRWPAAVVPAHPCARLWAQRAGLSHSPPPPTHHHGPATPLHTQTRKHRGTRIQKHTGSTARRHTQESQYLARRRAVLLSPGSCWADGLGQTRVAGAAFTPRHCHTNQSNRPFRSPTNRATHSTAHNTARGTAHSTQPTTYIQQNKPHHSPQGTQPERALQEKAPVGVSPHPHNPATPHSLNHTPTHTTTPSTHRTRTNAGESILLPPPPPLPATPCRLERRRRPPRPHQAPGTPVPRPPKGAGCGQAPRTQPHDPGHRRRCR
jgi:hypothetical protein